MVDVATRFGAARVLNDKQSDTVVMAFERGWVRTFGAPRRLSVDEGAAFSSDRLATWCEEKGVMLDIAP
eukprot:1997012-Prorocentrum_lima.AAC.1